MNGVCDVADAPSGRHENPALAQVSRASAGAVTRRTSRRRVPLWPYLFALPYAILLVVFALAPAAYGIVLSVLSNGDSGAHFVFLQNYITTITFFAFPTALLHVLEYIGVWLPTLIVMVLFLALLLHARPGRFASTAKVIYYLPGALTGSPSALLWVFLLTPIVSPYGPLLHAFGFQHPADILESGYHHLPFVFAIQAFFTGAGGWILVFYGALEGLSSEILEAAAIDGCSAIQQALYIKLPLMSKYVYYMVILSFAGGMQLFVEPQLFNAASAVYASNVWSLNQVALRYAFTFAKFGVAASIAVILLILGIIAAFIILRWTDFYSTDFS